MKTQKPAIVVHGGAGEWRKERRETGLQGVNESATAGFDLLKHKGTALDAVETSIMAMEDNDAFNAGLGSSLTLDKRIEMEASIMDGKTLGAGATALVGNIKHPIKLARIVMENTDHIFLAGQAAEELADLFNLKRRNPHTKLREKYWRELRSKMGRGELKHFPQLLKLLQAHPSLFQTDTVGAVAVDNNGNVAAATSTGGISLKIPGRIGDSPLIGSGTYADNESGACSATGLGEIAMRLVLAKSTCQLISTGQTPQLATETSINEVNRRIKTTANHMGLIAINPEGQIGAAHNSPSLCWAFQTSHMQAPKALMKALPKP